MLIVQSVLNTILGLVGLFFVVRYYPEAWGILSFGIGFVGLFTFLSDLGYSNAYTRYLSMGEDEGTVNATFGVLKLLLGFLFVVVTIVVVFLWTDVLHNGFEYPIEYWVILGLIPYYFFTGLVGFFQSFYRSRYRPARYVVPSMFEALFRNSIFIFMGVFAALKSYIPSINEAAIMLAVTYDCSFGLYVTLYYIFGRPWKFTTFSWKVLKKFTYIAIPLTVASVVTTINLNIDKVLIQFYYGAFATGGFYLDQRIASNITSFASILTIFFLPVMARLQSKGTDKEMASTLNTYEKAILIFLLPFVIGLIFLSPDVIRIFNGVFVSYSSILVLLGVSALFAAFAYPSNSALIAKGKARPIGIFTVLAVIVNIGLNLLFIPSPGRQLIAMPQLSLGPVGAGISSMLANIMLYVGYRVFLHRASGIKFDPRNLIPLVSAGIEAVYLCFVLMYIPATRIYVLVPLFATAFVVYVLGLLLTRQVRYSELAAFLKNILNPFHISNTFKKEVEEMDPDEFK